MALTVTIKEKTTGVFTLFPQGEIDTNTYGVLEKQVDHLLQSAATVIVFDMQGVEYISSAGVRVVLKAQKALKKKNGKIVLMHLQPQIKKVFEIINALPSMQVFTSIDELDAYLDQIQRKIVE